MTFNIHPRYMACIEREEGLKKEYGLRDVQILPILEADVDSSSLKKRVALEGARYLQRIITDNDIIGLTWGETMYHLIQYLNPCRRKGAKIVTLHGSIVNSSDMLDVDTLVKRAAMAFGGKKVSLCRKGLLTQEEMAHLRQSQHFQNIQKIYGQIDIAVTSVGAIWPKTTSLLGTLKHLSPGELQELTQNRAVCDIVMRYIDGEGRECDTSMRERTYSIGLSDYRRIPTKILVASGTEKAEAVRALSKGQLFDVLITDELLASAL
ncbi:sugar-binding transcriptional regulator [Eubacterium aggregans]|uniref:sugar-binding transcriptional regulator n=1 Tax=Eubacterium aggregans TaxID=81409 RepID=UPI0015A015B5|nr:sugar-binding domain-containing protein [Eubacterium aggregans]